MYSHLSAAHVKYNMCGRVSIACKNWTGCNQIMCYICGCIDKCYAGLVDVFLSFTDFFVVTGLGWHNSNALFE